MLNKETIDYFFLSIKIHYFRNKISIFIKIFLVPLTQLRQIDQQAQLLTSQK